LRCWMAIHHQECRGASTKVRSSFAGALPYLCPKGEGEGRKHQWGWLRDIARSCGLSHSLISRLKVQRKRQPRDGDWAAFLPTKMPTARSWGAAYTIDTESLAPKCRLTTVLRRGSHEVQRRSVATFRANSDRTKKEGSPLGEYWAALLKGNRVRRMSTGRRWHESKPWRRYGRRITGSSKTLGHPP
jgi:hypothetical protein